jgi:hypothetical protein
MSLLRIIVAALVGLSLFASSPPPVAGDYVEVRSNEVFTCACRYSGQTVTSGREAILAWSFRQGEVSGVPLADTRSVAVIQGNANLGLDGVERQSVLFIDAPTQAQRKTLNEFLREHYTHVFGRILNIYYVPVSFERDGERFRVRVGETCEAVLRPARLWEEAHGGSALRYDPFVPTRTATLATTEYIGTFSFPR